MNVCEMCMLGSRDCGSVGVEIQYQQLNLRWFGTCKSSSITENSTSNCLTQNFVFETDCQIFLTLSIYAKKYSKWLEIDTISMVNLQKSPNSYKIHAGRLVEDELSSTVTNQKFIPSTKEIHYLTTGHSIVAGQF
jgi:hypothetical protein